jgi:alpha-N-arabinofuranosidase
MTTNRRQFLQHAATGAIGLSLLRAQTAEARVEVLVNEPIGRIAPEIYGHFVENLGGVVYDGIWVGEQSKIANIGGLRKSLIDALRAVKPSVVRWPGGCFADQYDWHDGTGPREKRPRRTNFWADATEWPANANKRGPQVFDPNQFGTVDFARFCRATGSQPYFAANLRSLPPQDFWHWLEYCNSPAGSTTLADLRAADGERDPLNVKFWGVGNESWGCGGNFTADEYATEFRRYTAWTPDYTRNGGQKLALVGSGPNGGDIDWTRRFFAHVNEHGALGRLWGWALHHYSWNVSAGRTTNWAAGKGDAVKFGAEQYYELLHEASQMDGLITRHWDAMGEVDRRHNTKLVVDEWGSWHAPGTEPFPEALIGQQNTMRDAVLAGMTLDTFHRHADKVGMACIAQLVNCLQSLFLAHEDKFCVTPTYHVFGMYAAHQGAQSLRIIQSAPSAGNGRIAGLSSSASLDGKRLTLTVTNPSMDQEREVDIMLRGASVKAGQSTVLAAKDVHACNTFDAPNTVQPAPASFAAKGRTWTQRFPPASVTKLALDLE